MDAYPNATVRPHGPRERVDGGIRSEAWSRNEPGRHADCEGTLVRTAALGAAGRSSARAPRLAPRPASHPPLAAAGPALRPRGRKRAAPSNADDAQLQPLAYIRMIRCERRRPPLRTEP